MTASANANADQLHAEWEEHLTNQIAHWQEWREKTAADVDSIDEARAVVRLCGEIDGHEVSTRTLTILLAMAINRLARKETP